MPNPESCRFAKTHEWVFLDAGVAVVGVSDHAQHEITDVVFIELPKKGRQVKSAEAVAVVESVKAAFDIYAPVSGEVIETNETVVKDPALVNSSPQDKGWLFKLKAAEPKELDALMTYAQYQDFIKQPAH
jgi:glycine cleavage system H protein